ncbi:MAG: arsenate reductase ArsC [Chloroflexi bacterium]|nr:arsenate reductase ArsC [Chloroflexota bacterium]
MNDKVKVLILCTANSARSQMGEGLLRHLAGDAIDVFSAGAKPSSVNPYAVQAMNERGIDISNHSSEHVGQYLDMSFDYVITVCDNAAENCPVFPGPAKRIHWSFPDPTAVSGDDAAILASFVEVQNGLEVKLRDWLQTLL